MARLRNECQDEVERIVEEHHADASVERIENYEDEIGLTHTDIAYIIVDWQDCIVNALDLSMMLQGRDYITSFEESDYQLCIKVAQTYDAVKRHES